MPTVNVNGLEMYYELEGSGPTVVLIGGLSQDHLGWAFQVPALAAAGYQVLSFDNRDAGQTAQSSAPYTILQFVDDTVGLMQAAGIGAAHIVGLSMGGMIAQEIAIRHPERVTSLALVATGAAMEPENARIIRAWKAARPHCDDLDFVMMLSSWLFTHRFFQQVEAVQGFLQLVSSNPFPQSAAGFQRQCDAVLAHDTRDRLSQIRVPTQVIVGAEDTLTPLRYSEALAVAIPGAKLTVVPDASHVLTIERADAFNRVLLEFLGSVGSAGPVQGSVGSLV